MYSQLPLFLDDFSRVHENRVSIYFKKRNQNKVKGENFIFKILSLPVLL
jgi:hypothetical protein